jgi:predicted CoA-binding protein
MKELNIGDKVKAVRVFRNPDFRFDGVKEIIATDSYLDNEDSLG